MDVGDRVLSNAEAWETGQAQFTVTQGVLFLVLVAILWRGALWPRWPIVVWCPVCILSNIGTTIVTGIGKIEPLEVVPACLTMLLWVWASWRYLFCFFHRKTN